MSVYFEGSIEDRLYLFAFSSTSFMMKDITEERRFRRRLLISIVGGILIVMAAAIYVILLYTMTKGPAAPSPFLQDGALLGSIGVMAALVFYTLSKRPNVDYSAPDYETSYRYVRVIGYPNEGMLSISIDTSQGTYEYQVKVGKQALGIIRDLAEHPTWRTRVYSY